MTTKTLWGVVNKDGSIKSSGGGFTITHQGNGEYIISFSPTFSATPSIVGSQVLYGQESEKPLDNVVFPFLNSSTATAFTGDSKGDQEDRSFSFIAIGPD
jgi:hypothetical protein